MSPWPDPLLILTAALTLAAVLLLLNVAHAQWRHHRTPGPPAPVPPVPPPVSGPGRSPGRPGPAPGHHPRLLMTSRFYSDGVVFIDDHIKHVTRRFDPPADDDGWDAAAERLIRDLRD